MRLCHATLRETYRAWHRQEVDGRNSWKGEPAMKALMLCAVLVASGQIVEDSNQADETQTAIDQPSGQALPDLSQQSANETTDAQSESQTASSSAKPRRLIEQWLKQPESSELSGAPISLLEVVSGAASRAEQTGRAKAYWTLVFDVASYYLCLREATEQEALRQATTQPGSLWDEARTAAETRRRAAFHQARASQIQLASILGIRDPTAFPLPSDVPHAGDYETRHDQLFTGGSPPEAEALDSLIRLKQGEIQRQANDVAQAREALMQISQQREPDSDGTELLIAYELYRLRRHELLQSVADYNMSIARYTLLAAPDSVSPERLVSMLIEVKNASQEQDPSDRIQQANAEESAGEQNNLRQSDYEAETSRARESERESSGERSERSIVVPNR